MSKHALNVLLFAGSALAMTSCVRTETHYGVDSVAVSPDVLKMYVVEMGVKDAQHEVYEFRYAANGHESRFCDKFLEFKDGAIESVASDADVRLDFTKTVFHSNGVDLDSLLN